MDVLNEIDFRRLRRDQAVNRAADMLVEAGSTLLKKRQIDEMSITVGYDVEGYYSFADCNLSGEIVSNHTLDELVLYIRAYPGISNRPIERALVGASLMSKPALRRIRELGKQSIGSDHIAVVKQLFSGDVKEIPNYNPAELIEFIDNEIAILHAVTT